MGWGGAAEYEVGSAVVHPWHLDQFGHMNVRWYSHFFDDASFQFLQRLGLSPTTDQSAHCVTARATTEFKSEVLLGTCLKILGSIKRIGGKSLTLHYRLVGATDGRDYANCETVEVFVDAATHQSTEIPDDLRRPLEHFASDHSGKCDNHGDEN